jgi:hypothetical protein
MPSANATLASNQAHLPAVATPDEQRLPAPASRDRAIEHVRPPWRWKSVSLLWRVFAANIVVRAGAFGLLAWAPVTVHRVATPSELLIVSIGLGVMLAVDLVLVVRAQHLVSRLFNSCAARVRGGHAYSYRCCNRVVRG